MQIIIKEDISKLNLLMSNGILQMVSYRHYQQFTENQLKLFMLEHGIYTIPTTELIFFLKSTILGSAIEIGAGNGAIARALGIPATDAKLQDLPEVKLMYAISQQPTIQYPNDVEKLEYQDALTKYQPDTVIGSYITHKWQDHLQSGNMYGVQEEDVISRVTRYINIGNLTVHHNKPILKIPHQVLHFPYMITRSPRQDFGRIWIWTKA